MQDAGHTMMISDIATSSWLIDFCHKAIVEVRAIQICGTILMDFILLLVNNSYKKSNQNR